jgi:serine phosphatase RsbU (regulator of sigma subunit)
VPPGQRRAPPPALRRPGGTSEFIDLPAGLLLGAGQGGYPAVDTQLPEGSVLALYTDGLIERPGEDIGIGMSWLARALAAGPTRSLDDLCDSMLATLAPRPRDDIALLLARSRRNSSEVPVPGRSGTSRWRIRTGWPASLHASSTATLRRSGG